MILTVVSRCMLKCIYANEVEMKKMGGGWSK